MVKERGHAGGIVPFYGKEQRGGDPGGKWRDPEDQHRGWLYPAQPKMDERRPGFTAAPHACKKGHRP